MKYLQTGSAEEAELLSRFIDYARTFSTSSEKNADQGIQPSTECQRDFANKISAELVSLGFEGVQITKYGYVYGYIPAGGNSSAAASFCLLSHLDTVEEVSGLNVKPQIIRKDGKKIITSDGTTLLGGDDKAGLAAIVTALHYLLTHRNIQHPKIEICFSPDEETGHGMDHVPLDLIKSKFAYTVDGGSLGQLESECFNAYKSEITFTGRASHTGDGREHKMVNAITAASAFVASLPRQEAPETTDGHQGFYAPYDISGNMEKASVSLLLRDFYSDGMEIRKKLVKKLAEATAASFGASAKVKHTQQYLNMKDGIDRAPKVLSRLVRAYKTSGVEPVFTPIRGGTDGSRLTEMGIPCPNIFTGAHEYHSAREYVVLEETLSATDILICLAAEKE